MRKKQTYEWVVGSHFVGDPTEVGQELERIHRTGPLTPEVVVACAKTKGSVLHPLIFDGTTAEDALSKYQLARAQQLIKSVNIVVIEGESETVNVQTRGFQRVTTERGSEYVTAAVAASNAIYSTQIDQRLRREMRSLKGQLDQWNVYNEVSSVLEEVLA